MINNKFSAQHEAKVLQGLLTFISSIDENSSIDSRLISSELKTRYLDLLELLADNSSLPDLINLFSACDHLYYKKVLSKVTSEEDHSLLIHSISNFGVYLSQRFQTLSPQYEIRGNLEKVLFVIKGPFNLAHMSFAKSFYLGYTSNDTKLTFPYFVFLDDSVPSAIKSISFDLTRLNVYSKMVALKKIISENSFGTIIWPSVAQNVSLFMGSRFAKCQIYWSARYKNQLFDTVDKYFFGARSSRQNIAYNGVQWGHGRFHVCEWNKVNIISPKSTLFAKSDRDWEAFIRRKINMNFLICGTISSGRKMNDSDFHHQILSLLQSNDSIYYFYTSRNECCPLQELLNSNGLSKRFKRIDWIHTMSPLLKLFDLIIDSFPVGSSHALCYALQSSTPFISMASQANRESSLLNTLMPLIYNSEFSLEDVGFALSKSQFSNMCMNYAQISQKVARYSLLEKQRFIVNQCLNSPTAMYQDFSELILA